MNFQEHLLAEFHNSSLIFFVRMGHRSWQIKFSKLHQCALCGYRRDTREREIKVAFYNIYKYNMDQVLMLQNNVTHELF